MERWVTGQGWWERKMKDKLELNFMEELKIFKLRNAQKIDEEN